ncbi:reverse transcriptase domain-containing protein [Tanacetum coccineum]|uniref:Reverse transcriptase domain-containing protein n=1 Tax=Tanacetum coccineum TaxID=301880 RepID=A0ABQ5FEW5_9ASTR
MSDIKGISPSYCTHKILMEDDYKPVIQPQRRLNSKVQDVVKNEIVKLLDSGLIYPILDSSWVIPIHVVPKKGEMTVVLNDNNQLIPSQTVTRWRVCIDYRKLNDATRKDHFPLPFIDQMLECLCGNEYYCFLDGFSGFFQISIALEDQEKKTFTSPYGTFAYRRMPFGLCNAPASFQRCMTAIFHDMVEDFIEVFMVDFSVFEGIVLGHKISGAGIEVDRAKIDVIAKLPYPTNVKGARIFLGRAGFYRSKTLNNAQEHYTTIEKEVLAVVFSFDKFRQYLVLSKTMVYTDHSALKYLFSKEDSKPRLIRLENLDLGTFAEEEITDDFLNEHLMILKAELNNDEPWLVYEKACQLPVEIEHKAYWALKQCNMDLTAAAKNRFMELNELKELRGDKNFKEGDKGFLGVGFHEVPLHYTGNYMPSRPDLSFARLDDYVYKTKQLQQSPSGQVPVNAAKQSSPRAATSISTARPVNTDAPKPKVNDALPITYSYFKAHSRENAVQSSHAGFGDQQEMVIPTKTLQDQGIFNSGCSRHMTGNKSFLTIIKKYLVEFVAFRGSPTGGIKRKFSVSRTPQQNGFGLKERKDTDRATRTVLADFIITYNLWAEAVRTPSISFMRPFGCPVTILNTLDPLVKFDGKADESWEATSQLWKQPMNCQTYSHNQKYIGNMPKYQIIGDINSATQTRRMIKISEEHAMILEGQPKLGLWYPRDSPFDLEAFSDSDYAGASLDRKSTTGGC